MTKLFRHGQTRVALPPGTLDYAGARRVDKVRICVMDYGPDHAETKDNISVDDVVSYRDTDSISWINIDGLHDTDVLRRIGSHYGLHPLVLEDIVSTQQRPKLDDHEDYLYIVARMIMLDDKTGSITSEQISLVMGKGYVLSFQEVVGDVFDPVRARVEAGKGRLRHSGSDYLLYALLDAIVDNCFVVLEKFSDRIEVLEETITNDASPEHLATIHAGRRELILLRKNAWPLREVASNFERSDSDLIAKETRVFVRDVYDHTIQVIDAIESLREMLSSLQDLYLSSISNRMNEVMKVLTVIATIFVPLTFVAGVYGMNFVHMPELGWKWSYPLFWAIMVTLATIMLAYFRRNRWF